MQEGGCNVFCRVRVWLGGCGNARGELQSKRMIAVERRRLDRLTNPRRPC